MIAVTLPSTLTLAQIVEWSGGVLHAASALGTLVSRSIAGASIDTRSLERGALFVPLPGSHVDGHQYLPEAFRRGAAAALCQRERHAAWAGNEPGPLVVVDDVTIALQRIAHRYRSSWDGLVIGVTGSSGKTTTKDLVALALATDRSTLSTQGNLNNHWGVPLTLLALEPRHRALVIEMGSNHPGEIADLAAIAAPRCAVVTNAGSAHLEHFGSLEAIAREKAALAFALPKDGVAFVSADSPALGAALEGVPCRVVTYGFARDADVRPDRVEDLGGGGSRIEVSGFPPFTLALAGRHLVPNALAALAVARELGIDRSAAAQAIESYRPSRGRMEIKSVRGATLLVDCYNANPESMRAALETLSGWPGATRRIAILGDMLELGASANALHRATGSEVRDAELWVVGDHVSDYVAGARERGIAARAFGDLETLAAALALALAPGLVVLLKASRGVALERVLDHLGTKG